MFIWQRWPQFCRRVDEVLIQIGRKREFLSRLPQDGHHLVKRQNLVDEWASFHRAYFDINQVRRPKGILGTRENLRFDLCFVEDDLHRSLVDRLDNPAITERVFGSLRA